MTAGNRESGIGRAGRCAGIALLLLGLGSARGAAQGLVSPGPLSSAHARIDDITKCLACHEAGHELSGRKCLACHVSLAARIRADQGFHAQATRHGTALACASCHSEHNGRPYRLVRWEGGGREAFDHTRTGWALDGAHARARCDACHRAGLVAGAAVRADASLSTSRTYLGLGTTCASCHLDEHRGRVSRRCEDCHSTTEWKPAPRFDHARTRFVLTGRHAGVACAQCHTSRREVAVGPGGTRDTSFVDFRAGRTGTNGCAGCHASPHPDRTRMARCEACHSVEGWFVLSESVRRFDHAPTGFPLRGAHATTRCEDCHLATATAPLPSHVPLLRANFLRRFSRQRIVFDRCDACHVNPHETQLGGSRDCAACHDETAFTPTRFGLAAHDTTNFPLTGAHAATPCSACHAALAGAEPRSGRIAFRHPDRSCAACHRDQHGGQFAPRGCDACHATSAWSSVVFDHDSTRYPLRGAHRTRPCSACHTRPPDNAAAPVRYAGLPVTCEAAGCHTDPHGGQFADRARGGACTVCHSEAGWRPVTFDHQTDSDWALDGAHRDVPCASCHISEDSPGHTRYRPLPHRCEDCHKPGGERS